jgi:hypothetical protein
VHRFLVFYSLGAGLYLFGPRARIRAMKTLLCILFFVAIPIPASASGMDGNQMLEKCHTWFKDEPPPPNPPQKEIIDAGYCAGYFDGVLESQSMLFAIDKQDHVQGRRRYCRPEEATNGQVMKVVKKWLDNNPEKLHCAGETVIFLALVDAFPCR